MRIIVWDIETGYNVATIFSLFTKYTPFTAIQQERYMICAAYTELGSGVMKSISLLGDKARFKKDPADDYYVVTKMHKVLSEADAVIAHYGDNFDMKFFNTRALYHGLPPIPPLIQIDTYKIAKAKFLFNCNKLDYLGQYLGLGKKIATDHKLWLDCLKGNQRAVKDMVTYNRQDVALLEAVYHKLAPYANTKINLSHGEIACPNCASYNLRARGFRSTLTNRYRRYVCNDCGKWSHSTRSEKGGALVK